MRLSGALSSSDDRVDDPVAVLHAALDAGVRLLDTADVYAPAADAVGHNERLVAEALRTWSGDASTVTVATKGGLLRTAARWQPDGRAKHLRAACEASLDALGVSSIALYQLHAVDPRTPLQTSVRALAKLQRDGLVERVGLCNVNLTQLQQARQHVEVASVQVEVSPAVDESIRGGVVAYCRDEGIDLLGYRPFCGAAKSARLAADPCLSAIAQRRQCTAHDVVLAWLTVLGIEPLPGPSRVVTAGSCARRIELVDADLDALTERFAAADILRRPMASRRPPGGVDHDGDVVMVMGMPGAGKTTHAAPLVEQGYARLNRDELGGRLADMVLRLDEHLANGQCRVVLDNTYGPRSRRNHVIETAWRHGIPARAVWVDTPIEQARIFAVERMLKRYDRLLSPDEMKAAVKDDPNSFPPRVQTEFVRTFEPPRTDEGLSSVQRAPLVPSPAPVDGPRLLILDIDRVCGRPQSVTPALVEALRRRVDDGWSLAGFAWRPQGDDAAAASQWVEALGLEIAIYTCPHPAGAATCWCRPPMPGLLVLARYRAGAHPSCCVVVGATSHAERYAKAAGAEFLAVDCLLQPPCP